MKKYHLVSVALAIGLLGSASAMAAPPDKTPPGTEVVDSRGAVVGNLVSQLPTGQSLIERQINGVWYTVYTASGDGLIVLPPNALPIYYTSTNCTGTAYLDARPLPPIVALANSNFPNGGGPVNSAAMDYPAALFQDLPISSSIDYSGTCSLLSPPTTMSVGLFTTTTLTVVPPLSVR